MPNVQVAVRCRPALPHEGNIPTTRIECNEVSNTISVQTTDNSAKTFSFDKVIPESATQDDVFDYVSPMVDHALDGLHATVFAYGQTGSGKTFTMEGLEYQQDSHGKMKPNLDTPIVKHGILPRVIETAFQRAQERMANNGSIQYKLKCSFTQLYNERVTDLLNPSRREGGGGGTRNGRRVGDDGGLKIRWTRNDQFAVENLYVFECDSPQQMREMFQMGVREKVMGSHHMNIQSSRSHCLFTIYVVSWDPNTPDCQIKSELTLVDLAGSEKLALLAQNPSAQLLKESIEINTSLLSLGKVITALATNAKSHVPYRDSKLTKLLKHALGGNAMTMMIACINPLDAYVEESTSTLLYAGRARNITNTPHVNEDPRAALIRSLREEIVMLKTELEYYRQLATNGSVDAHSMAQMERLQATGKATQPQQQRPSTSSGNTSVSQSTELVVAKQQTRRPASEPSGDVALAGGEDNYQLAEKLIESCKMLKNLMGINGQLRQAFDKVNEMKAQSEKREVELNAENSNLRERIEMLESIALNSESNAPQVSAAGAGSAAAGSLNDSLGGSRGAKQSTGRSTSQTRSGKSNGGLSYGEKLSAYNSKYRNPTKGANYEEFYGVARKPVAQRQSASSQIVKEIERLTRSMPKATTEMIPTSLQSTSSFGSLAFGGMEQDREQLEEKRRARQARMQALQAQHATMQKGFSGFLQPSATGAATSSNPSSSSGRQSQAPGGSLANHNATRTGSGHGRQPDQPSFASMMQGPGGSSSAHQANDRPPSSSSHTSRLFDYLSQEDARQSFTQEQLNLLQRRTENSRQQQPSQAQPQYTSVSTSQAGGGGRPGSGRSRRTNSQQPFSRQDAVQQQQEFQKQLYEAQQALMSHRR